MENPDAWMEAYRGARREKVQYGSCIGIYPDLHLLPSCLSNLYQLVLLFRSHRILILATDFKLCLWIGSTAHLTLTGPIITLPFPGDT